MSKIAYCLVFLVLMLIVGNAKQPQKERTADEIDALPVIPRPPLTASHAIEIAERSLRARPQLAEHQLVSVEWVTGSSVPSPYPVSTHGASCSSLEDPRKFSWFVTFVYRDDNEVKTLANLQHPERTFHFGERWFASRMTDQSPMQESSVCNPERARIGPTPQYSTMSLSASRMCWR